MISRFKRWMWRRLTIRQWMRFRILFPLQEAYWRAFLHPTIVQNVTIDGSVLSDAIRDSTCVIICGCHITGSVTFPPEASGVVRNNTIEVTDREPFVYQEAAL